MNNLEPRARKWLRLRICVLGLLMGTLALLVVGRAYKIQVAQATELREMAQNQQLRVFRVAPRRGTIFDREGTELAVSVDVDSVFANPRQLRANGADVNVVAAKLAKKLHIDQGMVARRLSANRYFVWIKRKVTPQQAAAVRKMDVLGLELTKEARRFYPNRHLASHLLGFSNVDGHGIAGLELSFNDRLRGADQRVPALRDRRGKVVFSEQLLDDRAAQGDNLTLTIDKTIQHIAERELAVAVKTFEAKAGSVVVTNPKTGEILAIANNPSFNPNEPGAFEIAARRNRALTDRFEPGSTIKPFTMAAALKDGKVGAYQKIDCENGAFRIADATIHDSHGHGKLTPTQILAYSSNIGIAKIAEALGKKKLYNALRAYGFGEPTGLPLPGETGGSIRHYRSWHKMDTAAISFGQGLSVNSVQLAMGIGALANGGQLMKPMLIKRITDGHDRLVEENRPQVQRRVTSTKVATLVSDMLTAVTGKGGTGMQAAVDGYLVAGKTGTAQKADHVAGGYADDKWVASFVGYLPADDPKVVISVMIDEPIIAHYGGSVAGPVFRRVAAATMRHLGVPASVPRGNRKNAIAAIKKTKTNPLKAPITVQKKSLDGSSRVPDMRGLPMRDALALLHSRSLVPVAQGSGILIAQDIRWGELVQHGTRVKLTFDRPELARRGVIEDVTEPASPRRRR